MYGLTRGAATLIGIAVAGVLIWLAVDPLSGESISRGEFWWAALMCGLGGFVIAWPFAFAVNRAMIRRGKGHAVVHEYHPH